MSASAPSEAGAANGVAWYVYGVIGADADPPPGTAGVAGEVGTLREGSLAALVSRVPLDELGEERVRARLEDPAWLAEKARAHEAVLEAALGTGAVVPFRMLTVFRDGEQIRDFLARRGAELDRVLGHVQGKVEIGVKAFVDRDLLDRAVTSDSSALTELDAKIAAAQAGHAYLLQRQRDQAVRDESTRRALEIAEQAHARLLAAAEEGVANPVQSRDASGRAEEMLLNGAYLVRAADPRLERELRALNDEYRHLGVTFEQTGPWPPYNFVPRDLGEEA